MLVIVMWYQLYMYFTNCDQRVQIKWRETERRRKCRHQPAAILIRNSCVIAVFNGVISFALRYSMSSLRDRGHALRCGSCNKWLVIHYKMSQMVLL